MRQSRDSVTSVANDSTETNLRDFDAEFDVDVELIQKQTDYLSTSAEEFDDRAWKTWKPVPLHGRERTMSILTKHDCGPRTSFL